MRNLVEDSFIDGHGTVRVVLTVAAKAAILRHQACAIPNETGGVLIGTTTEALVRILEATPPPRDSTATPTSFNRGTRGVVKLLATRWRRGQYYVGEWHAHPNADPKPSGRDLMSLDEVARDGSLQFACPVLVVAGGRISAPSFTVHVRWLDGTIEKMQPAILGHGPSVGNSVGQEPV
jgi:integrative and conjugative element protein (TIGR02256 family)